MLFLTPGTFPLHTHTHTLSPLALLHCTNSLFLSLIISLSLSLSLSIRHTHTHTHTDSIYLYLSHTPPLIPLLLHYHASFVSFFSQMLSFKHMHVLFLVLCLRFLLLVSWDPGPYCE